MLMPADALTIYGIGYENMVCCCCGHIGREFEPYEVEYDDDCDGEGDGEGCDICPKCGNGDNTYATYAMAHLWRNEDLAELGEEFGWHKRSRIRRLLGCWWSALKRSRIRVK